MKCPHCQKNISDKLIAHHLASKGGSRKKNFSPEEKERRRKLIAKINAARKPTPAKEI